MRLINITVDEVSLVDKAANKRKFCFQKRDTTEEIVKKETEEAQKILDADKEEFTPEEIEMLRKQLIELTELAALVKGN